MINSFNSFCEGSNISTLFLSWVQNFIIFTFNLTLNANRTAIRTHFTPARSLCPSRPSWLKSSSSRQRKPSYDPLETQRTSDRLSYYCLSDWEGDSDPPIVACQCSYWKSPSICSRYRDCEGQFTVFHLMWRSLRSFHYTGRGGCEKNEQNQSAGNFKKAWIIGLSLKIEHDWVCIYASIHAMHKTRTAPLT